jgi:uncharacterized membrane protein
MESRVKLFGHPIHPMLIVLPLGLLIAAVVFDILYLVTDNTLFAQIAYYDIILGILGGLTAAIFGLIDWLAIPSDTRAKSVGLYHGLGNVVVVILFGASWFLRMNDPDNLPSTMALVLSFAGIALGTVTGWLGGELVDRLGVGVDPGANLNAPNSLSDQPAHPDAARARSGVMLPQTGRPHEDED